MTARYAGVAPCLPRADARGPQEVMEYTTKSFNYKFFRGFLKEPSILCDDTPMAAMHRRAALPMFHKTMLDGYFSAYKTCAKTAIKKLKAFDGQPFDCMKHNGLLTLDVLLAAGFGHHSDCQVQESPIPECFAKMNAMVWRRTQNPFLWAQWMYDLSGDGRLCKKYAEQMHNFCYELVRSRREALEAYPLTGLNEVVHPVLQASQGAPSFMI